MFVDPWEQAQRRINLTVGAVLILSFVYFFLPPIPVMWGPSADQKLVAQGRELFSREWSASDSLAKGDGLGPVFNGRSCAECHDQGGLGGGGNNSHNVTRYEVMPTLERQTTLEGLIHADAINSSERESLRQLEYLYPIKKGVAIKVQGCIVTLPDFNPVRTEQINTTALFGLGYIDQLPGKAIVQNNRSNMFANIVKEFNLDFEAIGSGRPHILPDGRVGKFGWKAQFATLEEFVASACANELGLGNPSVAQATPIGSSLKPDNRDLSSEQVKAMNAFVTMLPKPTVIWPTEAGALASAQRGEQLFEQIGCAVCHVKNLAGVDGVYSDFLLHRIQDARKVGPYLLDQLREVPRDERQPAPEEWKTPPLWGVADSAPYMHDGSSPTLRSAILQHAGDANTVTRAFKKLEPREQDALIDFLNTLRAPANAEPIKQQPKKIDVAGR